MDQKPHGAGSHRHLVFYQWLWIKLRAWLEWESWEIPEGAGGSLPPLLQPGAAAVNEKGEEQPKANIPLKPCLLKCALMAVLRKEKVPVFNQGRKIFTEQHNFPGSAPGAGLEFPADFGTFPDPKVAAWDL